MCQPGRPLPQGASQAVSSSGLCPFQSAKSSGSSLRSRPVDALALVHLLHPAVRELAVLGIGAHAEVDVAVGRVGVAVVDQRPDQVLDRPDGLRRQRLRVGASEPEPVGVLHVARGHLARQLGRVAPLGAGGVVDLVVDVGDVDDQRGLVADGGQEPAQDHEDDVGPGVADVDAAVDGRAAGVDADAARLAGLERHHRAGPRVVQPDRAHAPDPSAAFRRRGAGTASLRMPIKWLGIAVASALPDANSAEQVGRAGEPPFKAAFPAGGTGYCAIAVTGQALRGQHLEVVERAFRRLPDRYLGAEPGFDATYHVRLGDVGHTWEVRCTTHGARVRKGVSSRRPDVTIGTDSETWPRLREGELSGIEAFSQRKLYARGNLDLAIGFEGLFRLPNGRPPLLRIHDVHVGRTRVSTLTMGRGEVPTCSSSTASAGPSTRSSTPLAALSRPLPRPRDRPARVRLVLEAHHRRLRRALLRPHRAAGHGRARDRARAPGRQLDGRPGGDRGRPDRARTRARPRPPVPGGGVDQARLSPARAPAAARVRARCPTASAATPSRASSGPVRRPRSDRPVRGRRRRRRVPAHLRLGRRPPRLPGRGPQRLPRPALRPRRLLPAPGRARPARLFVWSSHDRLVPPAFRRHVERWLPDAEQIVLDACGHVPQVERPEQTNGLLRRFFADVDALGASGAASAAA